MPANSFLGQAARTATVIAEEAFAFHRTLTYASVLRIPAGGTELLLPDSPRQNDFYEWANPDNSAGMSKPVTLVLSDEAIAAGVTIQGAATQAFTTPGTSGQVVYFEASEDGITPGVWQLFGASGSGGGGGPTVAGTGLWHNIASILQAVALLGTPGQFCVTNTTPDAAFVSISGDVDASIIDPGLLTVVGIRNVPVPMPSGNGTVLTFTGGTFSWAPVSGGAFAPGSDILGNGTSTATNQFVSALSFSSSPAGGPIPVNGTNTRLNWITNAITLQQGGVTLLQLKAVGSDFLALGAAPAASGLIRVPGLSTNVIVALSGGTPVTALGFDATPNLFLDNFGGGTTNIRIGGVSQASVSQNALTIGGAANGTATNLLFANTAGATVGIGFTSIALGPAGQLVISGQTGGPAGAPNDGGGIILQGGIPDGGGGGPITLFSGTSQLLELNTHHAIWTQMQHFGDSTSAATASWRWGTTDGIFAVNVAVPTVTLTPLQLSTPVIQLTGNMGSGTCTITLPDNDGAMYWFDTTPANTGAATLVFTTGTGTPATVNCTTLLVGGKKLINVCVLTGNIVSAG